MVKHKRHILKLSGGKDSEDCLWWCLDNLPFECWEVWYNDTEWESPLLYMHLKYLEGRVGKKFKVLRNNSFKAHLSDDVLDKIVEIFGHESVFAEMVAFKKRFPSIKARFCTTELKVKPAIDEILDHVHEDCVIIQGVRRQESEARRNLNPTDEYFKFYFEPYGHDKHGKALYHSYRKADVIAHCDLYTVDILRPILFKTHDQVFQSIFDHGSPGCELYRLAMSRVGCFPCVNASLGEVLQISLISPETIIAIRKFEVYMGTTFFAPGTIPAQFCSLVREVRVYADQLLKLFGNVTTKKAAKIKQINESNESLFEVDRVLDPERRLYQMYFQNEKIPVYIDEDGDEYIYRKVRCCTIDDVVKYVQKNPKQASMFQPSSGCISVYNICEVAIAN